MSPVEVSLPSPHRLHFNEVSNEELRRCELDFLEERINESQSKLDMYQRKMTRQYNSKVKKKAIHVNDLVLQRVFLSTKKPGIGTLRPNWEDPYRVREKVRLETYCI